MRSESLLVMYKLIDALFQRSGWLRRVLHRHFYQCLDWLDRDGQVTLMNYGYSARGPDVEQITLDEADEPNRLCLQLYHHVASAIDLSGLDVLEVGSGRGGGAAYMHRYLQPRSLTAVDYATRAVAYCQRHHGGAGVCFRHGDAEHLPLPEARFDAVINIESSHCYGDMGRFLREVYRVLRPGGYLLWADHRPPAQWAGVYEECTRARFAILHAQCLTSNVLAAMTHRSAHNRALIDSRVPRLARHMFYHFAGLEGTYIYNLLASGRLQYAHLVLRKNPDGSVAQGHV